MTAERLEALLMEARDEAASLLGRWAMEEFAEEGAQHDAKIEDARAVWHTTEFALGMLRPGYLPKREAIADARELLSRLP
jgi:hypothetical protein